MLAEAPPASVPMTEGNEGLKLRLQTENPGLSSTAGGAWGLCSARRRGRSRHNAECRLSAGGSSAMSSAALHARELLLVFFGDRGG
jgi:hypothetical protein